MCLLPKTACQAQTCSTCKYSSYEMSQYKNDKGVSDFRCLGLEPEMWQSQSQAQEDVEPEPPGEALLPGPWREGETERIHIYIYMCLFPYLSLFIYLCLYPGTYMVYIYMILYIYDRYIYIYGCWLLLTCGMRKSGRRNFMLQHAVVEWRRTPQLLQAFFVFCCRACWSLQPRCCRLAEVSTSTLAPQNQYYGPIFLV